MKTAAAVLRRFSLPLVIEERKLTSLKNGEVLIRISASGVCGSDVHMWKGKDPRTRLPLVLGHEGVGIVEEVRGEKRDILGDRIRPQDFVVWDRGLVCGKCYFCAIRKEPSLCLNRQVYGIVRDGTYATHLVLLRQTNIIKIDGKIDPPTIAPVTCSGATAAHATEQCEIMEGDVVVIQGPGPMGMFALALAQESGAGELIVIGTKRSEERLRLSLNFGATAILVIDETSLEERLSYIKDRTKGRGADVVIDCTGSAHAIKEGLRMTASGGIYAVPGVAIPIGEVPIDFYEDVARKNVRIQGVWVSDTSHLHQAVRLVLSRKYPFEKLVTHRFKLEQATQALETVEVREAMKAVLLP